MEALVLFENNIILLSWVLFAVLHYFLSPLLVSHGFIPVLLSNLLFMVAASYYHYLNFLGYDGKICLTSRFLQSYNCSVEPKSVFDYPCFLRTTHVDCAYAMFGSLLKCLPSFSLE